MRREGKERERGGTSERERGWTRGDKVRETERGKGKNTQKDAVSK